MSEMNSLNEVKCEYYVPMGKPGVVVIKVPVVLSILKISIPINNKFRLDTYCSRMEIVSNKISINKPKINKDNKLLIKGNVHKYIKYFNDNLNNNLEIDIPINSEIIINFNQIPIYNQESSKGIFCEKSHTINCNINSIELITDCISELESIYCNEIVIDMTITLTQIQDVFIPEPEGKFILNSTNIKVAEDYEYCYESNSRNYLVGYDNNKGLIANKLKDNK